MLAGGRAVAPLVALRSSVSEIRVECWVLSVDRCTSLIRNSASLAHKKQRLPQIGPPREAAGRESQ